jgi:hypothetical protein
MSTEADLIAALQAASPVAALAGTRVFLAGARQGSDYPYVTIQRVSTTGADHLDGPANLEWPRFQIDCWSPEAKQAAALAEAVRTAIDHVTLAFYATFQDWEGPAPDPETRNFRVRQDYLVWTTR